MPFLNNAIFIQLFLYAHFSCVMLFTNLHFSPIL